MTVINDNHTIDSILNNSNNLLLCSSYKNKYEQIQCPNKRKSNLMFCGKHRNMTDVIFNNESVKNSDNLNNLFLSVGYKKHFGKDWMWKANFTPLITNNKEVTLPWIGVYIGKRF